MTDIDSRAAEASKPSTASAEVKQEAARRLRRGAAVEAAGFGALQLIRLAANLILTRLLYPEAFGLMAMLSLVLYGIWMLSDVGIQQAVVRSPRGDDPLFLDTAWSIQVVRGGFLWVVACGLAWPASLLFREPLLIKMIPVGASAAIFHGLASTRVLTLRRHLRPLPVVSVEVGAQITGIVTMIALARAGFGVWSLVIGTVLMAVVQSSCSYALPGSHRERFRVDPSARHEITQFGRWIFASSATYYVAGRGDQFVVGRILGASNLAFYNIALALAEMPENLTLRIIGGILYPHFSKIHNERPSEYRREYYRARLAFDFLVHSAVGGLMALSPWLIHWMYDRRYWAAIPMLQVLALRTSISLMAAPCETALMAKGYSQYGFRRNLMVAVSTLIAMPLGEALGGTIGLLWGSAAARLAGLVALWPPASDHGILRLRREMLVLPFLATGYGLGTVLSWVLPVR